MRRLGLTLPAALLLLAGATLAAQAQSAQVVASCGPTAFLTAGRSAPLTIDTQGRLCGAASISGAGDATAANQALQITQETAFNTALGAMADAACATDNGTCSTIALLKRGNQRLTTIIAGIPVTNAGTFATQSAITAASGSVASGAFASGSMAAGSQVDLLTMRGTVAAGTAAANSILAGNVFNTTAPAPTNGQQIAQQADAAGSLQVNTEGKKATYSIAETMAPAASATDIVAITGSASKTVRITKVRITGSATAAAAPVFLLVKRSTANTGGTSTSSTITSHDSANAAASATALNYSANPTAGSLVGILGRKLVAVPAAATPAVWSEGIWDFSTRNDQAVILRGTSQVFAVNLGAVSPPSGFVGYVEIEWTEE